MKFEYHLIPHQRSLKLDDNYNGLNLLVFDGILNDTQIGPKL
jgi:hypothetical protein